MRVISLERHANPVCLHPNARPGHSLCRIKRVIDQVEQNLGLELRLPVASHRAEYGPGFPVAGRHGRDERVHRSLARLQPVDMVGSEAEIRPSVLQQHARAIRDDAGPEVEGHALDQ